MDARSADIPLSRKETVPSPMARFDLREYDDPIREHPQNYDGVVISNEPSLYETFPYIKHVRGAALGVGVDQMLDIATNSQVDDIWIIDLSPSTSLTTRALLEVGRRYKQQHNSYPTPNQFLNYLTVESLPQTIEMIKDEFDPKELEILTHVFKQQLCRDGENTPRQSAPLKIHRYLEYKMNQTDYCSWISSEDSLKNIIDMYERGAIHVVLGDLTGGQSLRKIGTKLHLEGQTLNLILFAEIPMPFKAGDECMPGAKVA